MRTVVYVDGYNLYYGRLRATPYKWLNIRSLIANILRIQDPANDLIKVVFCTAGIRARLATHGSASVEAQTAYHRALEAAGVEVVSGSHALEVTKMPAVRQGQKYPDPADRVEVWRMEEKQTDVNIALGMYRDAISGEFDQVVLVTSDTDLVPALQAIQSDVPKIQRGLMLPRHPKGTRPPTQSLVRLAQWTRDHINDDELQAALFPDRVPTRKVAVTKPSHW